MCCLLILICTSEEITVNATVVRMMIRAGATIFGAKVKICVMYSKDVSEVSPLPTNTPMMRLHS